MKSPVAFEEDFCILAAQMDTRIYIWNSGLLETSWWGRWYMGFHELIAAPKDFEWWIDSSFCIWHTECFHIHLNNHGQECEKEAKEEPMTLRFWKNAMLVKHKQPGLVWDFNYLFLPFLGLCWSYSGFLFSEMAIIITVRFPLVSSNSKSTVKVSSLFWKT